MKDFLQKYQNNKNMSNLSIIVTSLILAIWINIFLIDWTNIWNNLKASVLDTSLNEIKADIYIEKLDNKIVIKNSKDILDAKNISIWITYNPWLIEIKDIESTLWENIMLWEKNTWFDTYLINTSWNNIYANSKILEINILKNREESTQLNMINANFTDKNEENYNLSTSWITF